IDDNEALPNDQLVALQAAFDAFKASIITIDYAALQALIDECKAFLEDITIGNEAGNYTQAAVDLFQAVIDASQKMIDDEEASTQSEADDQLAALQEAFDVFEASIIITALNGVEASGETIISSRDNSLYMKSVSANPIKQVYVYNLQGRLIHSNAQVNATTYRFEGNNVPEICIVKVVTAQGIKHHKALNNAK
ncbi:MAG: hypothetical protein LBP72_10855, partial [Dysgonamonadaceae bacterium]|nr:hypothetical protein [Dysgonamonadaceae bacterium]